MGGRSGTGPGGMSGRWRLLRSGAGAPAHNMAVDEALLASDDPRPVLRLYAWSPEALSLGYFQDPEPFEQAAREAGAVIVRRATGGSAIHHADELTFCLVATLGCDGYPAGTEAAYAWAHDVIREALAELGVTVTPRGGDAPRSTHPRAATMCFHDTTRLDLVDESGRKVVGSAQRHRDGRVLHHGSIPLRVPSLSPRSGAVDLLAPRPVSWDVLADALVQAFARRLEITWEPTGLSPEEHACVERTTRGECG